MSRFSKRFLIIFIAALFLGQIFLPALADTKTPTLEVHFIDVGQGDSILLHSSAGTDILVDAGTPEMGPKVLSYLRNLKIKDLDYIVSTHPHADHIGGLPDVIAGMPVKCVIDTGVTYPSSILENYLRAIKEKKIPFKTVLAGDKIQVDDKMMKIEVLAPYKDQLNYGKDVNGVSIVLKVTYGNISFLLTGDAGTPTEDKLAMNNINVKSTILKVGHHGSRYSTSDTFLLSVKPEIGVIEVGADNDYGHPTPDTLNRLQKRNVQVYRTDQHGSIVVTTDGKTYQVKTEKTLQTSADKRVNINKAPMGDIADIPGMDLKLAQEIVYYRDKFGMIISEKELLRVKGMTPEILQKILPYIKLTD